MKNCSRTESIMLLVSIILSTLVVLTFSFSINKGKEDHFHRTYTDEELEKFCMEKDLKLGQIMGFTHPIYCSRYILCSLSRLKNGGDKNFHHREEICDKCLTHDDEALNLCPDGFKKFNEETQTCQMPSKNDPCRQSEKSTGHIWGSKGVSHVCNNNTELGATVSVAHPYHCGKYVNCYRDPNYVGDLFANVETCPSCDTTGPGCPDGYMHFHPPTLEIDGMCHLTTDIKDGNKCNPSKLPHQPTPAPVDSEGEVTTTPSPSETGHLAQQRVTEDAREFCQKKELETMRYLAEGTCHTYFYCYANLYDREGDMRSLSKVKSFKFQCPTCASNGLNTKNCPSATDGKANYLYFDYERQDCIVPENGTCTFDGNWKFHPVEPPPPPAKDNWKQPVMKDADVKEYCKKVKGNANLPHPTDPTCTRYIECWNTMGIAKERSCPPCSERFTDIKSLCPRGHLYFDKKSGTCQLGQPTEGCQIEAPSNDTTEEKVDPVDVWSTTPDPKEEQIEEEGQYGNSTHQELLETKTCSIKKFVQRGYCKSYFTCDRKTRMEKQHECSGRLYWNPDANSIHGGICDYLRNIDNFTLYNYKKDPGCPLHIAYFRIDEQECSGKYYYHHPVRTNGTEITLNCPEDLLFSREVKTCVKCHHIMKADGVTPCCPPDEVSNADY